MLFDRNIIYGKAMMYSVLTLSIVNNQGMGDVEYENRHLLLVGVLVRITTRSGRACRRRRPSSLAERFLKEKTRAAKQQYHIVMEDIVSSTRASLECPQAISTLGPIQVVSFLVRHL
jgi:hypothetical protein